MQLQPFRIRMLMVGALLLMGPASSWCQPPEDAIIQTYQKAIAVDPNDTVAHFNLGLAYYKLDRFEEARQVLEKCLRLNSADKRAHEQVDGPANQLLGIIYYSFKHDDGRAIEYFQQSLKWLPHDPDTYYALGLALSRHKEYAPAIQAFQQAVNNGRTKDPEVYLQLGRAQVEASLVKDAVASYENALALQPDFKVALEDLALLYHRQKDSNNAVRILERLVKADPMNFNANYLLGLHYYQQKRYAEMVAAYNRAVTVKPDLADAHYNLGMAYYYQDRYDMAVEALKKAVTLNPKDVEAYNLLGQAQTAAIETHLQQGSTYIAQDRLNDAIEEFQKVLTIDAENPKAKGLLEDSGQKIKEEFAAHINLAEQFYQAGRLEDSYNEYEQALKLVPDSPPAREGQKKARLQIDKLLAQRVRQGKAAEKLNDYQEAKQQYEGALQLKPNYLPAKTALAALEDKLSKQINGLYKQAQKYLLNSDLRNAANQYKNILKLSENLKRPDEWQNKALAGLTRANAQIADNLRQSLETGKAAFQSGDREKAKRAFNQVLEMEPQNKVANEYVMKLTGAQSQAKVTAELIKNTYYQGVDYYVKGKIEEAIQAWEKVIQLDPENQDARINIDRAKAKLVAIRKLTEGQ